jgi:predicted dehydrogenase
VDITLPHHLHYAVARAALEHGKHVLIEKPMAATSAECLELIDLARGKGLTFTVAENTRFVAAYIEAQRLVSAGALGQPRLIRTFIYGSEVERLRDTANWKGRKDGTLGGTIFDAGPHSFYLLKWLFGDIVQVQAMQSRLVPESEVEDHAVVAGRLANGALFSTEYSFTAEIPWGERCEIYGSAGSLIIDQLCNPPALHYHGARDYEGTPLDAAPYDPKLWKLASIAAGVQDFVDALVEGRPPAVDPMDGCYTLKVVEAAYASAAAGGQPAAV